MTGISVGVLGPTLLEVGGVEQSIRAPKLRALLGFLALHRGRRVTTEALSDALWPEGAPPSAVPTLRRYVADLRATVDPHREKHAESLVLRTLDNGYALDLPPGRLDTDRLDSSVRAADEQAHALGSLWRPHVCGDARAPVEAALADLEGALVLWRGDPLADLGSHPDLEDERLRLHAVHLQATTLRSAMLVGLGRHHAALVDLDRLCRWHPWHEQLAALRALALTGCGRQVEALEHLRSLQASLDGELGIDADPEISRLQTDLLRQQVQTCSHPTRVA